MTYRSITIIILPLIIFLSGCKKYLNVPSPVGILVASQVFTTDAESQSVAAGMYLKMINTRLGFSADGMTFFGGMSADELIPFDREFSDQYISFEENDLLSSNGYVNSSCWQLAYSTIYTTNSIIDGLSNYSGVSAALKNELTGEAEFVRAFCHFYLVNLFGDIPLVTTINYHKTSLLPRTPASQVYQAIVADLIDAQKRLPGDYSAGSSQRIVPNKWASTALLARVYLYMGDWTDAEAQSTAIINNSALYSLENDPDSVFLANSKEAIWQLQQKYQGTGEYATPEGYQFIPVDNNSQPFVYLTNSLLNAFDSGDLRRSSWLDSTQYSGTTYYYPYKYKVGPSNANSGAYTEYYMVLRLAEQYLIRAEARAEQGNLNAVDDLDTIRTRAGLNPYIGPTDKSSLLSSIYHERQIELFAEWGNRWMDLKRTQQAITTLSINKGFTIKSGALLYPIPNSELATDPNLTQNAGY